MSNTSSGTSEISQANIPSVRLSLYMVLYDFSLHLVVAKSDSPSFNEELRKD